jgi:hypothetical protein
MAMSKAAKKKFSLSLLLYDRCKLFDLCEDMFCKCIIFLQEARCEKCKFTTTVAIDFQRHVPARQHGH